MVVEFNLNDTSGTSNGIEGIDAIEDGDDITIIAQAPAGGSTYATLKAPRRINQGESYILS
jgi:hypothetical protein